MPGYDTPWQKATNQHHIEKIEDAIADVEAAIEELDGKIKRVINLKKCALSADVPDPSRVRHWELTRGRHEEERAELQSRLAGLREKLSNAKEQVKNARSIGTLHGGGVKIRRNGLAVTTAEYEQECAEYGSRLEASDREKHDRQVADLAGIFGSIGSIRRNHNG
jgi:hypothetical protein